MNGGSNTLGSSSSKSLGPRSMRPKVLTYHDHDDDDDDGDHDDDI